MDNDFVIFDAVDEEKIKRTGITDARIESLKEIPQILFSRLEIDLVNNYISDVAILRVLHRYRGLTDIVLDKLPKFLVDPIKKIKLLKSRIIVEERTISLMLVLPSVLIVDNKPTDSPVYSKKVKVNLIGKLSNTVKYIIIHLAGIDFEININME